MDHYQITIVLIWAITGVLSSLVLTYCRIEYQSHAGKLRSGRRSRKFKSCHPDPVG